jgi:plastocyanin
VGNGRSRSRTGIYAAVAAVAVTVGLGGVGAAGARSAAEHVLTAPAFDGPWSPASHITIQTGDSVRWTFPEGVHNVQSTGTNWSPPIPDDKPVAGHLDVTYTFSVAGVYTFVCEAHPGTMDGTITVEDPPAAATPTPTPTPSSTAVPQPSGDTVKPTVRSVGLKALRRAVRVRFRLSEPATVTVRVKRRGSRKVLKSARIQAQAGTRTVTLRSKRLKKGRYTVEIQARDAAGNRSSVARKQLRIGG